LTACIERVKLPYAIRRLATMIDVADWPEVDAETVARRREMMEAAAARTGAIMANLRLAAAVADALAGPDVEAVNVTAP
jgi:hypothetical protein